MTWRKGQGFELIWETNTTRLLQAAFVVSFVLATLAGICIGYLIWGY